MSEYRYDLIERAKDKVKRYYDDLETLLAWLLDYGALDNMDGENCFKQLSKYFYEWECGDRSIVLTESETEAFDILRKRIGITLSEENHLISVYRESACLKPNEEETVREAMQ